MSQGKEFEVLRRTLRAKLVGGDSVTITAADLRLVLDELGRLQQASDRLRRQNRRLRLRLQRAGLADDEAPGTDAGDAP